MSEPVEYQMRMRPTWEVTSWSDWKKCSRDSFDDYTKTPKLHDWEYEVRSLYTTPQPKQEQGEPVAWMYWQSCLNDDGTQTMPWVQRYSKFKPPESVINKDITPLYTTPQSETKDEPVAYGYPNSAITGNQKWMSLREQIPKDDQYKGALWIPLYITPQPNQEQGEPVAWRYDQAKYRTNDLRGRQWSFNVFSQTKPFIDEMVQNVTPLYTTSQRTWVELKDEPVAWGMEKDGVIIDVICPAEHEREEGEYTIPLYTHPKEWVGLTDEEIEQIYMDTMSFQKMARALEAKLKERNT